MRWAREAFALAGRATPLPGDRDRNFALDSDRGRFVLKVAFSASERTAREAQRAALAHLAARDPDVTAPRPVPDPDGRDFVTVQDAGGVPCDLHVLTWVDGVPLPAWTGPADRARPPWGALAARIRRSLADFDHPGVPISTPWELRRAPHEIRDRMDGLGAGRPLVEEALQEFLEGTAPLLSLLSTQVVHNDLNDHNVIVVDGTESPRLGVIDFGDLTRSVGVAELAVACAYGILDTDAPLDALLDLVTGYSEVAGGAGAVPHPLEWEVLLPLVRLRLALSVSMSATQSAAEPDNTYLRVSEASAWRAIRQLAVLDAPRAHDRIRRAAGLRGLVPGQSIPTGTAEIGDVRRRHLGTGLSVVGSGIEMVHGRGAWLIAADGTPYLDLVNNVAHVGHGHPRVVEAAAHQMRLLNTNSRYLHGLRARYVERLLEAVPNRFTHCWLVCSGSEANELALRLARAASGRRDLIAYRDGYHGNTTTLVDASGYKHAGPGGQGPPEWVHVAPTPGVRPEEDPKDARERLLAGLDAALEAAAARGGPGALLAEALPGCGGQLVPPPGYLRDAYARVQGAGGVVIADEVQTGFGRVGERFWAFELQDAEPDVITMGKPIGNGHPLGAVVSTSAVADAFRTGMEYFNTFGGNPVSCAVGLAVMDVIEDEGLRENARRMGELFLERLTELETRHASVVDVRGVGLFLGVELGRDGHPDGDRAASLVDGCLDRGLLISRDGPAGNVLKIKPPLCIRTEEVHRAVDVLDEVLSTLD